MEYAGSINKLVTELNKLPGIGPKTAQRLAFHILDGSLEAAESLAKAIVDAKRNIINCSICYTLTDEDPCRVCKNVNRDKSVICVVEDSRDAAAIEKSRQFKGLYHVLCGAISPIDDIGPDDLTIKHLLDRLKNSEVKELIIATNPSVEGEATAMYIAKLVDSLNVKVTRIAHGLPVGSDLEYADEVTLARAFEGRRDLK